jgi:small conductance mechanosensitive channel
MDAAWQTMVNEVVVYLPRLGLALLVLLGCWLLGSGSERFVNRLISLHGIDTGLIYYLSRTARITLIFVGAVTALGTLGVNVTALVAGLGLTGFALGFAMKDLLSNALSGFLILFYKPFHFGDEIEVTSLKGHVREVNFRYTVLDAEGKWIYIPNGNLFTNPVQVTKRTA